MNQIPASQLDPYQIVHLIPESPNRKHQFISLSRFLRPHLIQPGVLVQQNPRNQRYRVEAILQGLPSVPTARHEQQSYKNLKNIQIVIQPQDQEPFQLSVLWLKQSTSNLRIELQNKEEIRSFLKKYKENNGVDFPLVIGEKYSILSIREYEEDSAIIFGSTVGLYQLLSQVTIEKERQAIENVETSYLAGSKVIESPMKTWEKAHAAAITALAKSSLLEYELECSHNNKTKRLEDSNFLSHKPLQFAQRLLRIFPYPSCEFAPELDPLKTQLLTLKISDQEMVEMGALWFENPLQIKTGSWVQLLDEQWIHDFIKEYERCNRVQFPLNPGRCYQVLGRVKYTLSSDEVTRYVGWKNLAVVTNRQLKQLSSTFIAKKGLDQWKSLAAIDREIGAWGEIAQMYLKRGALASFFQAHPS